MLGRDAIDQTKAVHDLASVAQRYTVLKKWSRREWAGPCPRCGGTDRFHVHVLGWWKCYQCHPRRADVIELVRWVEGCDFATAYARLGGLPMSTVSGPVRRNTSRSSSPGRTARTWRAEAEEEVVAAAQRLQSAEGAIGWHYLAQRGILPATWRTWGLGLASIGHARLCVRLPAIVMPWRHCGWLQAVTYRFIPSAGQDLGKADRFRQRIGGERAIYGSELLGNHFRNLILVEGELNAVSIWQAMRQMAVSDVDVLSFGSEGNATGGPVMELARGYQTVIVWADRPERAAEALEVLGSKATGLQSPRGMDANDLLSAGLLPDFLKEVLPTGPARRMEAGTDPQATLTGRVQPSAGEQGFVPLPLTDDPRPDLAEDSALWTALLTTAYPIDGGDPYGCFGALHGARCCGARLEVQPGGGWHIRRGEVSEAEWGEMRERWLLPHEAAIRRLLVGQYPQHRPAG